MALLLEIVEGRRAGTTAQLAAPVVVGRDPSADLALDDDQASRAHARISPAGGGATVEDLESTNGTWVNGEEVHAPAPAAPGDEIIVGTTVLALRTTEQAARVPSLVGPVPPGLAALETPPRYVEPVAGGPGPAAPQRAAGGPERAGVPELDRLVDVTVRSKARTAPLAIFVLVALIVILYLGLS